MIRVYTDYTNYFRTVLQKQIQESDSGFYMKDILPLFVSNKKYNYGKSKENRAN